MQRCSRQISHHFRCPNSAWSISCTAILVCQRMFGVMLICHDTTLLAPVVSGVQCEKCGHVVKMSFSGDSGYRLVGHIQHCVRGVLHICCWSYECICIRLQTFLTHYVLMPTGGLGHFWGDNSTAQFVLQRSRSCSAWHVTGLDASLWLSHGLKLHSRAWGWHTSSGGQFRASWRYWHIKHSDIILQNA